MVSKQCEPRTLTPPLRRRPGDVHPHSGPPGRRVTVHGAEKASASAVKADATSGRTGAGGGSGESRRASMPQLGGGGAELTLAKEKDDRAKTSALV